jgi:hypothetical protein
MENPPCNGLRERLSHPRSTLPVSAHRHEGALSRTGGVAGYTAGGEQGLPAAAAFAPVLAGHITAVNAFDEYAIVATFADDALVNDAHREFWGREAIRRHHRPRPARCWSTFLATCRVEGAGFEASVQDADEPVGEPAQGVVVLDAAGAEVVVEGAGAGRGVQVSGLVRTR